MTLEDEEKDAMARWRPVLASVGACACFGLIIRSLIRCHTPAFHTAFCCLTRLTRDLGRHDSHLLTCILEVRSNTLGYSQHIPQGENTQSLGQSQRQKYLLWRTSTTWCISGASKHLLCMAGRTSALAYSLNMRGMRRIQLQLQLPSADIQTST
jgi:hypothetical protein